MGSGLLRGPGLECFRGLGTHPKAAADHRENKLCAWVLRWGKLLASEAFLNCPGFNNVQMDMLIRLLPWGIVILRLVLSTGAAMNFNASS